MSADDYDYYLISYKNIDGIVSTNPAKFQKGIDPVPYCEQMSKCQKDDRGVPMPRIMSYEIYEMNVGKKIA